MKKLSLIFLLAAALGTGVEASAQDQFGENKEECLKYLSYYEEYYKSKNYDDALPNWRQAYKFCPPQSRQTMLINGANLMRRLIVKNAKNPQYKQALIDSLMTLHNQRIEYFPKYQVAAYNAKGQDVFNYIKNNNKRLFEEYNAIINALAENTKPTLFVHDFNAATGLFNEGAITSEELIDVYSKNIELLSKAPYKNAFDSTEIEKAKAELESRFVGSKVADCNTMLAFYGPKYEQNPKDADLATKIVRMLSVTEDCTENQLFLNAVTTIYMERPAYNSAYLLFRLNSRNGDADAAIKYMEEAIAFPESDAKQDADYYIELAQFCFTEGRSSKAYESALKAVELNPEKAGRAYFLIGNVWGSAHCGSGEIESVAHFWVAVDYMQKAKSADPSLTEEANKCIALYSKYFPATADAFMYNITDGQSYQVSCNGMKANTVVRTNK